jgi:hypothetical protein
VAPQAQCSPPFFQCVITCAKMRNTTQVTEKEHPVNCLSKLNFFTKFHNI